LQWIITACVLGLAPVGCLGGDGDLEGADEARAGSKTFTSPGTGIEVYGSTVMLNELLTCDSANVSGT
jgi:hypothetical protein